MISCIIVDDEPHARKALEMCVQKTSQLTLLGSFESAIKAWDFLMKSSVDLVFSDIIMPDIDGISFLKNLDQPPLFIFVTGTASHAAEGFELDVVDYILKPFDYARFLKGVKKAEGALEKPVPAYGELDFLTIKDGHKHILLKHQDIHYIKANKEYVSIVTQENEYLIQKTMKHMEAILPTNKFFRAQKSYIFNVEHASEILPSKIVMKGEIQNIPIGREYKSNLYKRLGIH